MNLSLLLPDPFELGVYTALVDDQPYLELWKLGVAVLEMLTIEDGVSLMAAFLVTHLVIQHYLKTKKRIACDFLTQAAVPGQNRHNRWLNLSRCFCATACYDESEQPSEWPSSRCKFLGQP